MALAHLIKFTTMKPNEQLSCHLMLALLSKM